MRLLWTVMISLPAVGNGTTLAGNPMTDLKTSIETAGDFNQIQVRMEFSGTQFGLKPSATPMPKTIRLENDGFKCPAPRIRGKTYMHVCCKKDPKYKVKKPIKTKFFPRQNGDLSLTYDILQAYTDNYQAQVTIDNNHPLGRLDHWNLTWEWMRGEFIYNMRGAYTHKKDPSECIYGPAGKYYQDFDFSKVMNCAKKPIIADLPPDRAEDKDVGKLPYCCKNGTILPKLMDESKARCSPPIRVDPTEFPDPSGLDTTTSAIASWQIICNITRPKPKAARCCVSFSAFYNDSVIPSSIGTLQLTKRPGWTARITLFNWEEFNFENWFTALQFKKASRGYENVYSFNGTMLPELNRTIFMQGLKGLNYLMGETNGTHTYDPRVPGKQQSVISFTKKNMKDFQIQRDGFPSKVFFNGEECALPTTLPRVSSGHKSRLSSMAVIFIAILTFMLMADHLI
ncbi:COBRA-like protein [Quillaja saponaria]|uniref:COBRA-like protein n=1 Tax=Quillaja saponaria TaxID=32244 RepID=A0AAD7KZI0_QUISA|nr:COBRA-like protein [Quillaja saponaria]